MEFLPVIGICVAAYLIGSIPFGLIVGKLAGIGDIRNVGSGNIGATNMVRAGGKKLGALVLLLDMGKGFIPLLLMDIFLFSDEGKQWQRLEFMLSMLASFTILLFIVIGHMYPVWLKFKGGKGVATAIGGCFGFHWMLGCYIAVVWLAVFFWKRYSSLASITAIGTSFFALFVMHIMNEYDSYQDGELTLGALGSEFFGLTLFGFPFVLIIILVIFKHRENIRRLRNGTESRFSFGGKKE